MTTASMPKMCVLTSHLEAFTTLNDVFRTSVAMQPIPEPNSTRVSAFAFNASGDVLPRGGQEDSARGERRRQPSLRPWKLLPSRSRMDARWLARAFRVVDVASAVLMAAPVTLGRDLLT